MLTKQACRAWVAATALLVAPAGATTAEDARAATAREVFLAAVEAVQRGDWLEARALYARSYALKPAPTTLYSLAVAQRETGELVEALSNFRRFLALEPSPHDARYREPAQRAVEELDKRVARVSIVVQPPAEGTVLRLDGQPFPQRKELPTDPGMHTVEASAPGHRGKIFSVRLLSGAHERLVVQLTPEGEVEEPRGGPPTVSVIAVSLGSALLSAGVTTGVVGVLLAARASDDDDAAVARRMAIAGDAMAVTGAVAAGLGAAFWIALGSGDDKQPAAVSLSPTSVSFRLDF